MKTIVSFFVILAGILSANISSAQTVAFPQVSAQNNSVSHASAMILPGTSSVNYQFGFWTGDSDTSWTAVQVLQPASFFQNVSITLPDSVVCDISWNGMFKVWSGTNPPVYSSVVGWDFPCPTWPTLGIPTIEILSGDSLGWVVMSVPYDTGGALADLFFHVTISELTPFFIEVEDIFGTGVWTFTSFVGVGNSVIFENFQLINIGGLYSFQGSVSATVPTPQPTVMIVSMETNFNGSSIVVDIDIASSGWTTSSMSLTTSYLCNGVWTVYGVQNFSYNDYVVNGTEIYTVSNLPQSQEWKFELSGTNGVFNFDVLETVVFTPPTIQSVQVVHIMDDVYEVEVLLSASLFPTQIVGMIGAQTVFSGTGPSFSFQANPYQAFNLQVSVNTPSVCGPSQIQTVSVSPVCSQTPTHNLETAYQITQTEAIVPLTYVNFGQCGFEGNVGVILVNTTTSVVDTVWSAFPILANSPSQNVLIALSGLSSGTSYLYKGVLKSGGQYFATNFQLSFTTTGIPIVVEPFFTNFFVAQEGLLTTVFFGLDLADFTGSPDIKVCVKRNSTQGGTQTIFDSPVSNSGNISFDYLLPGYGTHTFWCEVYHATLGTVYEATDNFIFTITGVVELEREVSEFDRVVVYNMSGQIVDAFERGQTVSIRNLPFGMYILQGIVGEETVALSKALRQQ